MQENRHLIFPVQITHIEDFLTKDQCEDVVNFYRNHDNLLPHDQLEGDAASTHTTPIRQQYVNDSRNRFDTIEEICENIPSCYDLKDRIQSLFDHVHRLHALFPKPIQNSWVSFQGKDSKLKTHTHPKSIFSLALYLKTDEKSSAIRFLNPNPYMYYWDDGDLETETILNNTWREFPAVTGHVYVFPSWLSHTGADINRSEERVVLSCNC